MSGRVVTTVSDIGSWCAAPPHSRDREKSEVVVPSENPHQAVHVERRRNGAPPLVLCGDDHIDAPVNRLDASRLRAAQQIVLHDLVRKGRKRRSNLLCREHEPKHRFAVVKPISNCHSVAKVMI